MDLVEVACVCTLDRDVVNTFCRVPYNWCLLSKFTSEILSHQIYGKQKRIHVSAIAKEKTFGWKRRNLTVSFHNEWT